MAASRARRLNCRQDVGHRAVVGHIQPFAAESAFLKRGEQRYFDVHRVAFSRPLVADNRRYHSPASRKEEAPLHYLPCNAPRRQGATCQPELFTACARNPKRQRGPHPAWMVNKIDGCAATAPPTLFFAGPPLRGRPAKKEKEEFRKLSDVAVNLVHHPARWGRSKKHVLSSPESWPSPASGVRRRPPSAGRRSESPPPPPC